MLIKISRLLIITLVEIFIAEILETKPTFAQLANINNAIDGNNNVSVSVPSQNQFNVPNIYPLDNNINTPVNTENDFGFNLSMGVNTLDANNVTVYLGFIFQPGRTYSHQVRMNRINKETELLGVQKQIAESQLQLLQKQISEAEMKLQKLQQPASETPSPNN